MGNIVNRVFDSSGPEGKVRGTPQQIIEKYLTLARDAQLGNDRVAAENFLQHSEHYARMLGEAQRELDAQRREFGGGQQGGYNGNGQGQGDQPRYGDERDEFRRDEPRSEEMRTDEPRAEEPRFDERQERRQDDRHERQDRRPDDQRRSEERRGWGDSNGGFRRRDEGRRENRRDGFEGGEQPRRERPQERPAPAAEVIELREDEGPGLVETPEMRGAEPAASTAPAPAAEAPEPSQRRARRPRAEAAEPEGDTPPAPGPKPEAAE
jgi:hypothetical protein